MEGTLQRHHYRSCTIHQKALNQGGYQQYEKVLIQMCQG
jgi:hypothetical protein